MSERDKLSKRGWGRDGGSLFLFFVLQPKQLEKLRDGPSGDLGRRLSARVGRVAAKIEQVKRLPSVLPHLTQVGWFITSSHSDSPATRPGLRTPSCPVARSQISSRQVQNFPPSSRSPKSRVLPTVDSRPRSSRNRCNASSSTRSCGRGRSGGGESKSNTSQKRPSKRDLSRLPLLPSLGTRNRVQLGPSIPSSKHRRRRQSRSGPRRTRHGAWLGRRRPCRRRTRPGPRRSGRL